MENLSEYASPQPISDQLEPVLTCPCCGTPQRNSAVLTASQVIHARIVMLAQEASRQKTKGKRPKAGRLG